MFVSCQIRRSFDQNNLRIRVRDRQREREREREFRGAGATVPLEWDFDLSRREFRIVLFCTWHRFQAVLLVYELISRSPRSDAYPLFQTTVAASSLLCRTETFLYTYYGTF